MDAKQFGYYINTLRKEKGLTQKDLAKKVFVSDKAISKWETGKSIPDLSTLSLLAEALNVDMLDLLQIKEDKDSKKEVSDNIVSIYKDSKKKMRYRYAIISIITILILTISIVVFLTKEKKPVLQTMPVEGAYITCGYGCYEGHSGVDISSEALINGEAIGVYVVTDGKILAAGNSFHKGYWIVLADQEYLYIYSNLDNIDDVEIGKTVREGELLVIRNPIIVGHASGPFVELTIYRFDSSVDPEKIIQFR